MRTLLAFLLCLIVASVPAGAADATASLDRTVTLDIWDGGLAEALQAISTQTGITIIPYPPDFPPEANTSGLYLITGAVPVRTVMECLARRYAFRYRLSNTGRIELSKRYDWAAAEPALKFVPIDPLIADNAGPDTADAVLRELIKPLSLLGGDYSLTLERSPTRDNPRSMRAVVVAPPVLADYLERGIRCLSGEPGDNPQDPASAVRAFSRAHESVMVWEDFLGQLVGIPDAADCRALLRSLGAEAGIALLLDNPPKNPTAPFPTLGRATLGQISEAAAERYGFAKRTFLAPGAIVYEAAGSPAWEMDTRQCELFWSGLAVAGFDARAAADRAGGPSRLVAEIRAAIVPAVWSIPTCALVFSETTGRLCVIAPRNVVARVGEYLRR